MLPKRLVMTFRHDSGAKMRVTLTEKPDDTMGVEYSLRNAQGIPPHLAEFHLAEWQFWFVEFMRSLVPPAIPSGWR